MKLVSGQLQQDSNYGLNKGYIVIQEIIYRKRGVELYKEVEIPSEIIPPYEMKPPTFYKPSLPVEFPHPLVQFGVRVEGEKPIAWFQTNTFDHRFETDFEINVNGVELFKRKYFFKD